MRVDKVNTLNRKGMKAQPQDPLGHRPDTKRPSSPSTRVTRSRLLRELRDRVPTHAHFAPGDPPAPPALPDRLGLLRDHPGPTQKSRGPRSRPPAAATATAARPPATAAVQVRQEPGSKRTRTRCRPRWPPLSTTPTATPRGREKRYILAPAQFEAATACSRAMVPRSVPATPSRSGTSRSARLSTTSSSGPGGGKMARGISVQRWPRKAPSPPSGCPPPRCAGCPSTAGANGTVGNEAERRSRSKGWPQPLEGKRPQTLWCGHEPGRPPAGRRGKTSGGTTRCRAGPARGPHPGPQQGLRQDDRPQAPPPAVPGGRGAGTPRHASKPEEGPVRRRPPAEEGGRPQPGRGQEGHQDLVPPFHDHPHGRSIRCPRRPQAHPG